jgi:hypothetical protein
MKLADILQVQDPIFYLLRWQFGASLGGSFPNCVRAPGHWENRAHLAVIQATRPVPPFSARTLLTLAEAEMLKQIIMHVLLLEFRILL